MVRDIGYRIDGLGAALARVGLHDTPTMLWWVLRIACAMCYIGHGAFGIIGKDAWLPFFALLGISAEPARAIMPLIGVVDIALGISVLLAPRRVVLAYMAIWAVWTAALRPLSGDSAFEMIERAGNYGAPLALLLLLGPGRSLREWLAPARPPAVIVGGAANLEHVLRWTTALLLIGHGALAAIVHKPLFATHLSAIGLPASAALSLGWIELCLALIVLAHPRPVILLGVVGWKLATEVLFPVSGAPIWEFIERGGSYGAPLALALLVRRRCVMMAETRFEQSAARSGRPGRMLAMLVLACMLAPLASGGAQDTATPAPRLEGQALVDSLRRGGYVLLFRHTETDHEAHDRGPAREQQRNLTPEGERHAREIGEAIRALRIPIGEIRASYMYRTMETGQLAFGRAEADSALRGQDARAAVRAHASAPVERGSNRVILGHNGTMSTVLEGHGVRRIAEGDIIVVEPLGEDRGFRVLAQITRDDWARLLRPDRQ